MNGPLLSSTCHSGNIMTFILTVFVFLPGVRHFKHGTFFHQLSLSKNENNANVLLKRFLHICSYLI